MPLNIIKFSVCLFAALFSIGNVFAQTPKIDSLKLVIIHAKEDTNKFRIYYNIASEYWAGIPDTIDYANTFRYEDSAYNLAKKLNYQYGMFDCFMCYGNVYAYQRKYLESRKYYNKAIEAVKLLGDKKVLADSYSEIADNFFSYGNDAKNYILNFPISLEFYYKALKVYEEIGAKYKMANTCIFIGRTYGWQNFFSMGNGSPIEMEKAVLQAKMLYKECKETTKGDIAGCDFALGRAKYFQGNYAAAIDLFLTSLKYDTDSSTRVNLPNTYINLGRAYKAIADSATSKGNKSNDPAIFKQALIYFNLSLEIYLELKIHGMTALCYLYIGDIERNLGMYNKSKIDLNKAIFYTEKLNVAGTYQEIYKSLAKLESAKGNYKQALDYFAQYMTYKEKITNENNLSQLLFNKAQYEFDKKEDSLNQKQIITETKLNAEKKQKYFYWVGLGMLSLLSFLVFRNLYYQRKINKLAAEAFSKEKIELELQSLKAQLNPHFIFNCINSIDAFIQTSDKYNATLYLNKFAKLIRNVLDSSKENIVPFSKDIETLRLYIQLEELRSESKFETLLDIDEELMSSDYKVPPLIIQPFVENAIIHGLRNKETNDGILSVHISKTEKHIVYSITDNGIGRVASQKINTGKGKSYGMEMSYDRVKLFNNEKDASVTFTDLYDGKMPIGTMVQVNLKIV